jgi:addiction module HigA family antidote
MYNPPHPGEVLQDTVLAEGRISVSEFARKLGVSRVALSRVVNGRAAVSADMALRLAAALGRSAESATDAGRLRSMARGEKAPAKGSTAQAGGLTRNLICQS